MGRIILSEEKRCSLMRSAGRGDFRAGREVFYDVAPALPLVRSHGDDEGYLHFIRLPDLVADALAGEIDGDGHVLPPQACASFIAWLLASGSTIAIMSSVAGA